MNINLTLIVQMLVFVVLIWFTMKFVWPMILGADGRAREEDRAGLAAAEKGEQDAGARPRAARRRSSARRASAPRQIIDQAQHRANELVEEAKGTASTEGAAPRGGRAAADRAGQPRARARACAREVAQIAVGAASKLLEREIDPQAHADLLDKLATQI